MIIFQDRDYNLKIKNMLLISPKDILSYGGSVILLIAAVVILIAFIKYTWEVWFKD